MPAIIKACRQFRKPAMTINKNKLHAALCIAASAAVSISIITWAISHLA
jgi:hypothetical protein